ncbi:MAG: hypothetical protein ABIH38_05740 [Patescibacteria group bacterium]
MRLKKPSKSNISFDFSLLFLFVVYFVIFSGSGHNKWFIPVQGLPVNFLFFFLAFLLLLAYFFVHQADIKEETRHYAKLLIVVLLILLLVFTTFIYQIVLRRMGASATYTHDGAIQTEEAVKFLAQGKNPYAENYRATPFGQFIDNFSQGRRDNPAWSHYVYLPFLPVFSLPVYSLSQKIFNFYDQRIVYGLLFIIILLIIYQLPRDKNKKIIGLIIFAFSPLFYPWFFGGYNDIFVYFWLIVSLYFLKINKLFISLVMLALACASKQSAWLILPFFVLYLFFKQETTKNLKQKIMHILKKFLPFAFVFVLLCGPFVIWGFRDFFDDIYRYPAGTIDSNYPMIGYGISYIIFLAGFVKSIWDYYPFWIIQFLVGLPLFVYLIRKQKENNTVSQLLYNYAVFLLVFWFFSRFFQDNYLSFLFLIFLTAWLFEEKDNDLNKKFENKYLYEGDIFQNK